ncbi:uncharacterized protein LOC106666759 isoform X2 [Cimex lectularius]|uniref:CUB domain-containing protein n=1 Tax=Cimex lectularius TaxID=79782 RepID=A0A8I6THL5_CIMLE|nr:uncharacterized protein LOC106666759 isoform X2 [Cimex lectularius]
MPQRAASGRCFSTLVFVLFALAASQGIAKAKNIQYNMQSLCKSHFLQQVYRKIDGAVLKSRNERNLDCVITFQTESILQRFMLRFDQLSLDCNDHLFIFDGAHAVGSYKADLSCRNTKTAVGSLFTRTNFVTLKYVTDGWGTDLNGFNLVITAVKDYKHDCKEFRCTMREFCIATDLVCDGINHCGDESDETSFPKCSRDDMGTIFGMSMTLFVVAIVSGVLIVCAIVVGISVCICRQPPLQHQNTNLPLAELSSTGANGAGGRKLPENLLPPAGLGYSGSLRARLYCQAK